MVISVNFIKLARVWPPLFQSKLIKYRSHDTSVPVNVSNSVCESVINIVDTIPIHPSKVKASDEELGHNTVKGAPGIKEEKVDRFFQSINRVLDYFGN